ncbi:MAG: 8-oxo-dGTP diphosphatase [Elusimicrobia bacterium]|jgi:8-oxo-dGTP diphosphatase|nr:8-oxo-dGTP diphosphatase [Elusimicrobiota bacterium]
MIKLATLCYVKRAGKTLMMHRVKRSNDIHFGKWNGLGGKLFPGETPEECVIREVREESGLELRSPELKGFLTFPGFDGEDDWYVFVFVARKFSGVIGPCPEGDLSWIPDRKLASLPLWEGDRIFMKWLNGRKFFSGKFVYKNHRLKTFKVTFNKPNQDFSSGRGIRVGGRSG